jgi:RecA-family ATPase
MTTRGTKESKKPLSALGINQLLGHEFSESPPVLQRGILPAGGSMIIAGDSGVGKSLLRNEISIRLAIGLDVFGIRTPTAQKVLIFQTENTMKQEQFRIRRIMEGLGVEQLPDRIFYAPPFRPCSLQNDKFLKYALGQIKEVGATLTFFDPLVSFHNRNENDNVMMRNVLDCITYLNREADTASIVIHHFGKPSNNQPTQLQYRMRGAMAIRDWCDTAITLMPQKSNEKNKILRLDFIKIRNGPWHEPITTKRDKNFVHHIIDEPTKAPPHLVADIVRDYGNQINSQNDLVTLIENEASCSRRTALKAINAALEEGFISPIKVDGIKKYESNQRKF